MTQECLVNGVAYSWVNITFPLFGRIVEGITAISYKKKQEKVNNYGRGKKAVSRGRGKEEYEASITIEMKEAEWIKTQANGSLLDLKPFDVPVVFSGDGVTLTKHTLIACEVLEAGIEVEQGSTGITVTLPLLPGDIKGL